MYRPLKNVADCSHARYRAYFFKFITDMPKLKTHSILTGIESY